MPVRVLDAATLQTQYRIIRRNGAVVPFEPSKITVAMTKAFLAISGGQGAASARIREVVAALTEAVVGALVRAGVPEEEAQVYCEAVRRGGTLVSVDDAEAKKVKGVSGTATIPRFQGAHNFQALGGVAVIADSTWAANRIGSSRRGPHRYGASSAMFFAISRSQRSPFASSLSLS